MINSGDFVEARRRLEAKPRALGPKVMPAAEAVGLVKDGDHVAIGGCLFSRPPMVLLREILRQRRTGLALSRSLMCFEGELFMLAGAADTIVTSWIGIGIPWGLSKIMRHHVEGGLVTYQEWSHLALGLRYRAGAMGVPFLPTLTMIGSDLMNLGEAKTITCPFTGEQLAAVPALFPDVALLHVQRTDGNGNCQIDGYPHMDVDIARAATTVIVSAEQIVDEEEIRAHPDRTLIPGLAVDAVVEAPFGAYPGECYGLYETDFAHFDRYVDAINADGFDGARAYLDRWVYGPPTHQEVLALIEPGVLEDRQRAARELVGTS